MHIGIFLLFGYLKHMQSITFFSEGRFFIIAVLTIVANMLEIHELLCNVIITA